ncbi:hypothetical protein PILCRDRAFT_133833 [Piloderma croceum F 1598]|uniref:Uncharacterized protein n=1 Tax=Piloderma croceum (strain F 1598) TaxID=765440 RepID=A0A0C3G5S7_PILCF|nr:hypothetical protein PILCRDRAFT_133833 [Piloderma croceum F 1598]
MPISSPASHNYLQILSLRSRLKFLAHLRVQKQHQAHLRHSHGRAGSPCPSAERRYATAAFQAQPNGLSHGPLNFKRTFADQAPDNHSRLSASGVKKAFRTTQIKAQQKKQASKSKASQEDPDEIAQNSYAQQGGIDKWAHMDIDVLDVEVPVRNDLPWGLNKIKYIWDNSLNTAKSTVGAYQIVSHGFAPPLYSIPDFPYHRRVQAPLPPVPNQISYKNPSHIWNSLNYSSTSPNAWLAGISGLSLDLYMQMCKAIAENDKVTLRKVTSSTQLAHALKVIDKRHQDVAYSWKFIKENSPTRIVSIRCADIGHRPRSGVNSLAIHVLSLEISLKNGTKDPRKAVSAGPVISGDKVMQRRILEYYVVHMRGWVKEPWTIKARIYDTSGFPEKLADDGDDDGRQGAGKYGDSIISGPTGIMTYFKQKLGRH